VVEPGGRKWAATTILREAEKVKLFKVYTSAGEWLRAAESKADAKKDYPGTACFADEIKGITDKDGRTYRVVLEEVKGDKDVDGRD